MEMPDTRLQSFLSALLAFLAVCSILYFGREILLPLVLAALLCFLLTPIVNRLEALGLGRKLAVICTSALTAAVVLTLLYVLLAQLTDFAAALPGYRENLRTKATSLHLSEKGVFARALETLREVGSELSLVESPRSGKPASGPLPVEMVDGGSSAVGFLSRMGASIFGLLATGAIVAIFVAFMLIDREGLRDRFIQLVGKGRLRVTTQAIDEAAQRVSRYLTAQSIVNGAYGLAVGVGLAFIGIPNAALWGILAAVFRFVPYLGPWIGAICPLLVAFAISPGWGALGYALALFFVLEMTAANVIEPWLYGSSTGISPMAVLVSSVFWAGLWGTGGLLLATPLTVCFVVLGKYVPSLAFVDVLLGDKPPIARESRFYQRLLAGDDAELLEIVERHQEEEKVGELFDEIVLPALRHAEDDFTAGLLDRAERGQIYEHISGALASVLEFDRENVEEKPDVLIAPARTQGDELAARMAAHLIRGRGLRVQIFSRSRLNAELAPLCRGDHAPLLLISAASESADRNAAALARRLVKDGAGRPIIGIWGRTADSPAGAPSEFLSVRGTRESASYVAAHRPSVAALKPEAAPVAGQPRSLAGAEKAQAASEAAAASAS